jgi:hypothetical protein
MTESDLVTLAAAHRARALPGIHDAQLLRDIARFLVSAGYETRAQRDQAMRLFERMAVAMAESFLKGD